MRERSPFVELAVTTPFSFGHGASHAHELILSAHVHGYDAIGVADRNTLAGAPRMHLDAREAAMRPLIGCRVVVEGWPDVLVYPRDRAAYGRLCRLLSLGRMREQRRGAKSECLLSIFDLAHHSENCELIAMPGDDLDAFEARWPDLLDALPGLRWVAAAHFYRGDDRARIARLDALAKAWGRSILATNDVHYHHRARRPLHDVMTCIRTRDTVAHAGHALAANGERHLKSPAEMVRLFAEWPHAIRATREVADAYTFSFDDLRYQYPSEPVPPGKTADEHLADLAWAGAEWRYPKGVSEKTKHAIRTELALIAKLNYAHYFLTVNDIVAFARGLKKPILCQGRGSAANSTVCFCLGITSVDPAETDLLIERFISEDRNEPPDIDVDFEHERREEVIQYIYRRYGRERAGLAATVIHYRPRMAIREVGRAMGLSEDVTAALARTVWGSWGSSVADRNVREAGLDPDDPHLARTIKLATELIGMPRHLSQHVGGFVLTEGPLVENVPVAWGAMPDRSFVEWDKDDLDALGLMKVDVLALGMLTAIAKCFDMLREYNGVEIDLASIRQGDTATYDMLCKADSLGVFQVESRAQMAMLPRMRPRCFYDLVIEVAIVRPGPIQGDMVHPYLRRRAGEEKVVFPSPYPEEGEPDELEKILSRTLGVPVFQEQAMAIAMNAAKFSSREANKLRKAMATFRSRGTIEELQDRMVGEMIKRGYDEAFSRQCFDQIKGFGEYGFPESHAASFAHLVYVSSWLKCHEPAIFCACLLNSQPMGFYAPAQIVRCAQDHGVEVRAPDVNRSDWDCTLEPTPKGWAVRLGLRLVDGFGEAAAAPLVAERERGDFSGPIELKTRARLKRNAIEALASADAFRSCNMDRRAALWDCRAIRDTPALPLFTHAETAAEGPEVETKLPEMPLSEHVVADYQTTRLSLKAHPVSFLREHFCSLPVDRFRRVYRASELGRPDGLPHGRRGAVAGVVLVRQRPGSAKGVCFLTIEDETGPANIVVWPKLMERYRAVVMAARLLRVEGEVQCASYGEGEVVHMVARHLIDETHELSRLSDDALATAPLRADHVTSPLPQNWSPEGADAQAKQWAREEAMNAPERRPAGRAEPPARVHPRDVRVIPKSRDFH